jgi:hypothetical protein
LGEPNTWGRGGYRTKFAKKHELHPEADGRFLTQRGNNELVMTTRLQRIVDKARSNKKLCFNNLAHHLSSEALREGIKALPKRTGSGCDGMTRDEALETFVSAKSSPVAPS